MLQRGSHWYNSTYTVPTAWIPMKNILPISRLMVTNTARNYCLLTSSFGFSGSLELLVSIRYCLTSPGVVPNVIRFSWHRNS